MHKKLAGIVLGSLFMCSAQAATWYGFLTARTNNAIYFFDADSVVKQPGSVTVWLKYVNSENSPDPDGSYSTASRTVYSCTKRTVQTLTSVLYDKNQTFMRSLTKPSSITEIVPGSIGELLIKVVCAPGFPNPKSSDYVRITDNDIFAAAKRVVDSESDPAPK